MDIFFDNIIFSLQRSGGGSLYWAQLLEKNNGKITGQISYSNYTENIFAKDLVKGSPRIASLLSVKRYINPSIKNKIPFIFHSSLYRVCKSNKAVNITTVHDFTYEYFRKDFKSILHKLQKKYSVMHSDGVICVSQNTLNDLRKFYPNYNKPVKVVYNGYSPDYRVIPGVCKKRQFLFIGSRVDYKNFEYAVRIVAEMPGYTLKIVGGGKLTKLENEILSRDLNGSFSHVGNISNEELNHLYNESFCLLYPSLYEGFGIPVAEAQAAGCPVVCCRVSSLPEVAGDAAIYIDGANIEEDLKKVNQLLDEKFYANLIELGILNSQRFSWDLCASETMGFYEEVFESKRFI